MHVPAQLLNNMHLDSRVHIETGDVPAVDSERLRVHGDGLAITREPGSTSAASSCFARAQQRKTEDCADESTGRRAHWRRALRSGVASRRGGFNARQLKAYVKL